MMRALATAALTALAMVAASCSSGVEVADAPLASTSAPADAATTSSTTAAPPTTAPTTTAPTTMAPTTTAPPSTLDIAGSPMIEFSVEVGDGVDLDREELVGFVIATLTDDRSWVGRGAGFRLVDDGGLFTIIVAEPERVDELCRPLQTNGRFSCARNGWIAVNSLRWFGATDDWPADLDTYRRYLVNHEVGHYLQGPAHPGCPGPGEVAPIMMQQTKGLDGCRANGWVDP